MYTGDTGAGSDAAPTEIRETLVAVEGITQRYGPRIAVEKLSLMLRAGEVFGLVGANGGGKTTTLRILAGILKPDQGRGRVLGFDVMHDAKEIRERVGYMSQRFSLYGDLSVFENLRFRAELYGLKRPRAAAENAIDCFKLREYARSPSAQLSGGWARRLQLAAALIHSPKLVLLDEPTAGLDVTSRQQVWRHIGRLAASRIGVVVSTHDLA
jgi:ABC-2 type transport system ATP-binding protein